MRRSLLAAAAVAALSLTLAGSAFGAARVYLPDYEPPPEHISGFQRAANGSLAPLAGSPFVITSATPVVAGQLGTAFTPEGARAVSSFLFNGGAQGLSVAPNGSIAAAGAALTSPSATGVAVSPDGRFAYTPTRTFGGTNAVGVVGYAIGASGALTELPTSPSGGTDDLWDLAITPNGRFLYAASASDVKRFSIASDGSLTELLPPAPIAATLSLQVSPDGRFLFQGYSDAVSEGVQSYAIGADGSLTVNGPPAATGDVSTGFFTVSPNGRNIYIPESNGDVMVTMAVAPDGKPTVVDTDAVTDIESAGRHP